MQYGISGAGLPDMDASTLWRARGWNVGIFYWNELADDDISSTERKIQDAGGAMHWWGEVCQLQTHAVGISQALKGRASLSVSVRPSGGPPSRNQLDAIDPAIIDAAFTDGTFCTINPQNNKEMCIDHQKGSCK